MPALTPPQREALDVEVDAALTAGHTRDALARLVAGYGPELLSFLSAIHHDRDVAADVFAQACEDLVRTFSTFRRECGLRTWLYALAKNASRRHADAARGRTRIGLSDAPELEAAQRSVTAEFLRTDTKDRFRALREQLDPSDRALLVLRVDRDMSWDEVAEVLAEEGDTAKPAALRKRFERIKLVLRESATEAGWLEKPDFPRGPTRK